MGLSVHRAAGYETLGEQPGTAAKAACERTVLGEVMIGEDWLKRGEGRLGVGANTRVATPGVGSATQRMPDQYPGSRKLIRQVVRGPGQVGHIRPEGVLGEAASASMAFFSVAAAEGAGPG